MAIVVSDARQGDDLCRKVAGVLVAVATFAATSAMGVECNSSSQLLAGGKNAELSARSGEFLRVLYSSRALV
eukprot:5789862-Pyramimonas_sp.AAC.1